jgi:hypothetical protein
MLGDAEGVAVLAQPDNPAAANARATAAATVFEPDDLIMKPLPV